MFNIFKKKEQIIPKTEFNFYINFNLDEKLEIRHKELNCSIEQLQSYLSQETAKIIDAHKRFKVEDVYIEGKKLILSEAELVANFSGKIYPIISVYSHDINVRKYITNIILTNCFITVEPDWGDEYMLIHLKNTESLYYKNNNYFLVQDLAGNIINKAVRISHLEAKNLLLNNSFNEEAEKIKLENW